MTEVSPEVRRGVVADMPAIVSLLRTAGLPTEDLSSIATLRTWVIETGRSLRGVIALEPFGVEGLLRSLAVEPAYRSSGFGRTLVAQLERDAASDGVVRLVLLTQTAEGFFRKLGYQGLDRMQVSESMQQSAEFRSLCPASAACMAKTLAASRSAEKARA